MRPFLPVTVICTTGSCLVALQAYSQTLQIVCQFDLLYILDCHITYGFEVDENLLI